MKGKNRKSADNSRSWGGYRESAGRPRKYKSIKLDFEVGEEESIIRALKLIPGLLLEDKISTHRARALVYCLKTMWEIMVPFQQIKDTFEEVKRQHANALLRTTLDPDLAEVLKDLPIDVIDKIRATILNKYSPKAPQFDYEKLIELILDQIPLEERDRILEKAKEQYISRKAPLLNQP